jgi:SPP1 gp7 family putative phage head morphogenesis protein
MIDFAGDPRGVQLQLLIERLKYERHVGNAVDALLDREFSRLLDIILSAKYRDLTAFQRQRAAQLFAEVGKRLGASYQDVTTFVTREMQQYAQLEATVARAQAVGTLGATAGEVSIQIGASLPKAYVESIAKLPIQGLRIGEWFDGRAATMTLEAKRIIQQGLIEGKGPTDIARRIVADARAQGPVLSRRAKQEARAITRTVTNAVQNDAALAGYERLPESVSDSYRLLVVLDARTTTICAALADRVFRYDDPARKVPPFHVACRTGVQPIIRGADVSIGDQRSNPMNLRSYADWLKAQPIGVQNDILGVTRADLLRRGKMSLSDAIDADARVLSLKELRAKIGLDATAAR